MELRRHFLKLRALGYKHYIDVIVASAEKDLLQERRSSKTTHNQNSNLGKQRHLIANTKGIGSDGGNEQIFNIGRNRNNSAGNMSNNNNNNNNNISKFNGGVSIIILRHCRRPQRRPLSHSVPTISGCKVRSLHTVDTSITYNCIIYDNMIECIHRILRREWAHTEDVPRKRGLS